MRCLYKISLCFLGAALLVACDREAEFADNKLEACEYEIIIGATQAEDETVTRSEIVGWNTLYWLPGDKISVFSAGNMAEFTSRNVEKVKSTTFQGRIMVDPEALDHGDWIHALYPYDANASIDNGIITTTLPVVQQAVADGVADDLMATAGRSQEPFVLDEDILFSVESTGAETSLFFFDDEGGLTAGELSGTATHPAALGPAPELALDMHFYNICSGLKFCLTQEGVESVTLSSNAGEAIAGTYSFTWDDDGMPVVSGVSSPSSSITLLSPDGEAFVPGVWYAFITLPARLTQGLTFTLEAGSKTGTRVISSAVNLKRATFSRCTDMDKNVEFEENEVEVQVAGPDTWVATDEQLRTLPTDVREKRNDREVVMLYWDWHCERIANYSQPNYTSVVNVTGVQWFYPEALTNRTHSAWGYSSNPSGQQQLCFWGEPLFGYYRTTDPWVLRKHAEMLADAGVDAVVFDCTNGTFMWWSSVTEILKAWTQAQQDGVKAPKIAFMLPLSAVSPLGGYNVTSLRYLWENLYRDGKYKNLWYYVNNKPLIMAYPQNLTNTTEDNAIRNFFTFRPGQPDYVTGDIPDALGNHQWGWLQDYPQHTFNNNEQITVGVAQNARDASGGHCFAFNAPGTYGRSYTKAKGNSMLVEPDSPGALGSFIYGYNFQEQWDRALAMDSRYILIDGWNEWVAYKFDEWPAKGSSQGFWPDPSEDPTACYAFADQYDSERSRDIEPTVNWGDHGDDYYYQLVQNVRRYKGIDSSYPNVSRKMTMEIDGDFSGWEKVSPDFKHYAGNTLHRNHAGHTTLQYTNTTGRNDFVDARVTRDRNYIYFYVETAANITSRTDPRWMRLLINIDRDATTGWKGYDFCLNYLNPTSATEGIVSRPDGSAWGWENAGTFDYAVSGNKMEIRVARSVLGASAAGKLDFEFKWADNNLYDEVPEGRETRILNLYVDGDAAPGGRFNFHYKD